MYQTRDITGQLKYFNTFKGLIREYKNDNSIYKISWDDNNFSAGRQHWIKFFDGTWVHEDVVTGEIYENLKEIEFLNKFKRN